jgi:hypothetical protein
MKKQITINPYLVAACGLYCGSCGKYLKGRCPGCRENLKASWCKVRSCCIEKGVDNCSTCNEFSNPKECKKYNNPISKIIGYVTNTDRSLCIEQIKEKGIQHFATTMAEEGLQSIPKKQKP